MTGAKKSAPTLSCAFAAGPSSRRLLQGAGALLGTLAMPATLRAQSGPKIRIGYWSIAAGLPFYAAVELGCFKDAGLNVEVIKFAGAQQIMEGMLADRVDGSANGTGSANIAVGGNCRPRHVQDLLLQPEQPEKTCRMR